MNRLACLDPEEMRREALAGAGADGKKRKRQRVWGGLAGAAIGIGLSALAPSLPSDAPVYLLRAVAGYFLAVIAHEAGHAVAARIARFRIVAFGVWPVSAYREAASWRFVRLGRGGHAGYVATYPIGIENLRRRFTLTVAGGPLASAVTAVACVMAAVNWGSRGGVSLVWLTGFWSALAAAAGVLPIRGRHAVSDGMRLRILRRGGAEADRVTALQLVSAGSMGGLRPRDWDAGLLAMGITPDDGSPDAISGHALRYNWLLDSGSVNEAEEELVWLLSRPLPDAVRGTWEFVAAWFSAFYRQDGAAARKWMAAAGPRATRPSRCAQLMAEAALALVEARWADTRTLVERAREECSRLVDLGMATAIREALDMLEARARQP